MTNSRTRNCDRSGVTVSLGTAALDKIERVRISTGMSRERVLAVAMRVYCQLWSARERGWKLQLVKGRAHKTLLIASMDYEKEKVAEQCTRESS